MDPRGLIKIRLIMKQILVTFETCVDIHAESFDEARKKFAESHNMVTPVSFYDTETHELKKVIGVCEISEQAIFEDDDFKSDNEGVMWLTREED